MEGVGLFFLQVQRNVSGASGSMVSFVRGTNTFTNTAITTLAILVRIRFANNLATIVGLLLCQV
jgi:hypothetical protein